MKSKVVVKSPIQRSSSSKNLRLGSLSTKPKIHINNAPVPRNQSLESPRVSVRSSKKICLELPPHSPFIKPISSKSPLTVSNSQRNLLKLSESIDEKHPSKPIHEYAMIDDICSKFTLKMIEAMRKEYSLSSSHEIVYRNFLAILSEIDGIFNENHALQFAMSRAREVFHLYMSRPGHVLQTLKTLPKLVETVQVSKKVISQCRVEMKHVAKEKLKGCAADIFEALNLIVSMQNKLFKVKVFIPKENEPPKPKGQENLTTEERMLDVSIIDLHTVPTEPEQTSILSYLPLLEESTEHPLRLVSDQNKSSKSRLLEQLYCKMNVSPMITERGGKENPAGAIENKNSEDTKCLESVNSDLKENIKVKPSRRSSSGSTLPGYMRTLKRFSSNSHSSEKKLENELDKKEKTGTDRKQEWEEVRRVRNMQRKRELEEEQKRELIEEMNRKKAEEEELKEYISKKMKSEKTELLKFKEIEIKEKRRLKELQKQESRKELMDEVARNIEKSQLAKAVQKTFADELFDVPLV